MPIRTIIEPFRIKSVEPIQWTKREDRERFLKLAHHNMAEALAFNVEGNATANIEIQPLSAINQ